MLGRIIVGSHCFSQLLLIGNVFSGTGEVCFAAASHHSGVYSLRLTDQPAATVLITEGVGGAFVSDGLHAGTRLL